MSIKSWLEGKLIPTRFEKAYILLYNGRISGNQFHKKAGIEDREEAWKQLCEYRERVVAGEIRDPRDKYNRWR